MGHDEEDIDNCDVCGKLTPTYILDRNAQACDKCAKGEPS